MNQLIIKLLELVEYQSLVIYRDGRNFLCFKLITDFGRDAEPFWVIRQEDEISIKYHFEQNELDAYLASVVDSLISHMDEAILNNEPKTI